MSLLEIKEALRDIPGIEGLTMSYALNGNQIFTLADVSVEVSPAASNDEIRSALKQPTIRTENTKVTVRPMSTKLQGLAAQIAKFKHDAEFEANKLANKIEGANARMPGVFSGAHSTVDGLTQHIDDVEAAMKDIEAVTNGGPAL